MNNRSMTLKLLMALALATAPLQLPAAAPTTTVAGTRQANVSTQRRVIQTIITGGACAATLYWMFTKSPPKSVQAALHLAKQNPKKMLYANALTNALVYTPLPREITFLSECATALPLAMAPPYECYHHLQDIQDRSLSIRQCMRTVIQTTFLLASEEISTKLAHMVSQHLPRSYQKWNITKIVTHLACQYLLINLYHRWMYPPLHQETDINAVMTQADAARLFEQGDLPARDVTAATNTTALTDAAARLDEKRVKELLENLHANPNAHDADDNVPLAATLNQLADPTPTQEMLVAMDNIISLLIQHGADLEELCVPKQCIALQEVAGAGGAGAAGTTYDTSMFTRLPNPERALRVGNCLLQTRLKNREFYLTTSLMKSLIKKQKTIAGENQPIIDLINNELGTAMANLSPIIASYLNSLTAYELSLLEQAALNNYLVIENRFRSDRGQRPITNDDSLLAFSDSSAHTTFEVLRKRHPHFS